jgi:hypothetical protein
MSTATSAKFNLTVLLWGNQWWLPGEAEPLPFANLTEAASVLAQRLTETRRLRLIYQPDSLTTVAVTCPQGNRSTVAAALGGEISSLLDPAYAWSHEPILPGAGEPSTLLHYEQEPRLYPLIQQLAALGQAVVSVWPLATFLQGLPEEWTETGAVTLVALGQGRALAYRHPMDGPRTVMTWQGEQATVDAANWLAAILRKQVEEPVWLVTPDESGEGVVAKSLAGVEPKALKRWALTEALQASATLPGNHPAQLLPPPRRITLGRLAIAASVALLVTASVLAGMQFQAHAKWQATALANTERKEALQSEVSHLRANQQEITRLNAILSRSGGIPPLAATLREVAASLPREIVLSSIKVQQRSVTLTGHVAPHAAGEVWSNWTQRLGKGALLLHTFPAVNPDGRFVLVGEFRG